MDIFCDKAFSDYLLLLSLSILPPVSDLIFCSTGTTFSWTMMSWYFQLGQTGFNNISVSFSFHPSSSKFPSWSGVPKSRGDDRGGSVSQISWNITQRVKEGQRGVGGAALGIGQTLSNWLDGRWLMGGGRWEEGRAKVAGIAAGCFTLWKMINLQKS